MIAIVTGASDGIGLTVARNLAGRGWKVHGIARSQKNCDFMSYHQADVSDEKDLAGVIAAIQEMEGHIDLLVVCAGISLASPADETAPTDSRRLFDVNFWGAVTAASLVAGDMKRRGKGHIIFLSSLTGTTPLPYLGFYSASKSALSAYAAALRAELAPFGVKVSTIAPGGVKTDFSYKRKKYPTHNAGTPGLARAIKAITAIEQNGVAPEAVAEKVWKLAIGKRPTGFVTVGALNQLLLQSLRILPRRAVAGLLQVIFVGPPQQQDADLHIPCCRCAEDTETISGFAYDYRCYAPDASRENHAPDTRC